eukprot:TRINITY_DN67840_c0_g1_i1.p1 TRINITY_DN67840_c0_g1~~TRINITY_DN67840_c0_g1_i1.p1  ORF type:complete len:337 (+),score=79.56 TRINITY_DN67840_c0_g1_i1:70-1080(+)
MHEAADPSPERARSRPRRGTSRRSVAFAPFDAASLNARGTAQASSAASLPEGADGVVWLHIYDATGTEAVQALNRVFRALGTGAFHAGVEVYGQEWSFGFTEDGGSGIFSCDPTECGEHVYREPVAMGRTALSKEVVEKLIEDMAETWLGRDYDLLHNNCCHFSDNFCRRLGVGSVPEWVTNLAGAGATVEFGLRRAVSNVHAAAMVAATRAAELDEEFAIQETVSEGAQQLLESGRQLDRRYAITSSASALASKAASNAGGLVDAAAGATASVVQKVADVATHRTTKLAASAIAQASTPSLQAVSYLCLGGRKSGRPPPQAAGYASQQGSSSLHL